MNKNSKNLIMLLTVVAVAILAAYWTTTVELPIFPFEIRPIPKNRLKWDIEIFYVIKTVISSVNITLLVFLLTTYVNIYREIKSEFTLGLIIFSSVLLLYALASNPIVHGIFGFRAVGLGPFAMLPDLFTFVALSVLLYLSYK
jgi:hypothetical protein